MSTRVSPGRRLVLGLGGTVDYEISWDSGIIESLVAGYGITVAELDRSIAIQSERDLVVSLLGFIRDGVGGERYVVSSEIVEQFASHFEKRITLGGTCVRAAMAMRTLGVVSTVHLVSIDDHVRRLLPDGCEYISSATQDTTDPHLIVQFGTGMTVRSGDIDLRTSHPNRIIFAHDPPNGELVLSDELGATLRDAGVFMISGFNSIQYKGLLEQRLRSIRQHMLHLPSDAIVFYEDAGFHVPSMSEHVRRALISEIDVYSMNEDEMQAYLGRSVDLLDADAMQDALIELRVLIPATVVVVHTRYWSVAVGEGAASWEAGLRGGITMASTRYSFGDDFTAADYDAVSGWDQNSAGVALAAGLEERLGALVRCIPAFDLPTTTPTTIGLGDSFVGGFIAALALGN